MSCPDHFIVTSPDCSHQQKFGQIFASVPQKNLLGISSYRVVEKIYHAQEKVNLHDSGRNLHCDIQQFPQLNPSHRAKEYQHLALSTLNTKSDSIIQLTHSQYILLSLF